MYSHPDIILLNARWYCRYALSYRDLEEMMAERGLSVDHSTINRWVLQYGPELDKRCRRHLRSTTDSWRVGETYIRVNGQWSYLYRGIDEEGNLVDVRLSATRDMAVTKAFFAQASERHETSPERVATDGLATYPHAIKEELEKNLARRSSMKSVLTPLIRWSRVIDGSSIDTIPVWDMETLTRPNGFARRKMKSVTC